jgi:hypothetical protein
MSHDYPGFVPPIARLFELANTPFETAVFKAACEAMAPFDARSSDDNFGERRVEAYPRAERSRPGRGVAPPSPRVAWRTPGHGPGMPDGPRSDPTTGSRASSPEARRGGRVVCGTSAGFEEDSAFFPRVRCATLGCAV